MDPVTAMSLDKGRKNNELLVQPQYSPMPVGEQVAILYCGTHALMKDVPLDKVREFESRFLDRLHGSYEKEVLEPLAAGLIDDNITRIIEETAKAVADQYRNPARTPAGA